MIAHIVLLRFRQTIDEAELRSFAKLFADTCDRIQSVKRARIGRRIDLDPGYERYLGDSTYDVVAILEFDDERGLRDYLTSPLHAELGQQFWEVCDSTVIFEGSLQDVRSAESSDDWVISLIQRKP